MSKVPQIVRKTSKTIGVSTMLLGLAYGYLWVARDSAGCASKTTETKVWALQIKI